MLVRVKRRTPENNLVITAAGVAFFTLIAAFPGLVALFGLYSLFFDPSQIAEQFRFLRGELRPDATRLLVEVLQSLASSDRSHVRFGIAGSAVVTLWGSSLAVRAVMRALNVAYGEQERRSFVRRTALALLLTVGAIGIAFCMALAVVSLPIARHWLDPGPGLERFVLFARWPAVGALFWLWCAILYRAGPSRTPAKWSWLGWGAAIATGLWLCGSALLASTIARTATLQQVYGPLGAVLLVLGWMLLSAGCVLLGAEINAELERQTRRDTTVGAPRPLGDRGAKAADTVGE